MKSKKQPVLACPIDAIGVSACPMAAFSGFYESPRPPLSGDACDIVSLHCNDHQNGHQSGYIMLVVLFAVALAAAGAIRSE